MLVSLVDVSQVRSMSVSLIYVGPSVLVCVGLFGLCRSVWSMLVRLLYVAPFGV